MPESTHKFALELTDGTYIIATLTFLIGVFLSWLICRSSTKATIAELSAKLDAEKKRSEETKQRLATSHSDLQVIRDSESELKQNEARLIAKLNSDQKIAQEKEVVLNKLQAKLDDYIKSNQEQLLQIANHKQQDSKPTEPNNQAVQQMLEPLTDTLQKIESRIDTLEQTRGNSHEALQLQAKLITDTQQGIQNEMSKLTNALNQSATASFLSEIPPAALPEESIQPVEAVLGDEDNNDFSDTIENNFEGFIAETPGEGI